VTVMPEDVDVWSGVVGQDGAVAQLRAAARRPVHAYLFVGPPGSTKDVAARAFAAELIVADHLLEGGGSPTLARDARLALAGEHPDVREYERVGPFISTDQARSIVSEAAMAPSEGGRKVLILHEFHLVRPDAAAVLLKSIEEPPPSTVFVVCADFVPTELITIASRCVRVAFGSIPTDAIVERLAAEGHPDDVAQRTAHAAYGDLDRARLLVGDEGLVERRRTFAAVPHRLDGTGARVMELAEQLLALIDEAAAPLARRHTEEVVELDHLIQQLGDRGSGRKALDERHKRELRRHRTDELRSGLGALASTYRDALVAAAGDPDHMAAPFSDAVRRIVGAIEAMERNPNEALLLQSLLWSLPTVPR